MAKKGTKGIITGIIAVGIIGSILSPDKEVESIELSIPNFQTEYDINTEIPVEISVLPEDATTDSLDYITSSDSITFSEAGINTGSEEGTYKIHIISNDIKSNTLSINVVDISAREKAAAEEAQLVREQAEKEADEEMIAEELTEKEAELERMNAELEAQQEDAQKISEASSSSDVETSIDEATVQPVPVENDMQASESNDTPSGDGSNFDTYDNAAQQQTESAYVLNTSSNKIHHPWCPSVKKIAPQNYSTSNSSVDELITQGYTTCGNCFK